MIELSAPQHAFLTLPTKYRAFVGGFGSGKTFVGCLDLLTFALKHPNVLQGFFAPTYQQISDIFYPTIAEAAEMLGLTVKVVSSKKVVIVYKSKKQIARIVCRSMDKPETIVGFKVARALVDEIDTMKTGKATDAWRKIVARLRLKVEGVVNGIGVTTTPEGFKFVYEHFGKKPSESYSMVQASTSENAANLPDDYIDTLLETYPAQLVSAYLRGEFVNMTSGSVYPMFDRVLNNTDAVERQSETLHIGMDFNVLNMSAVVHVIRDGQPFAVDEILGVRDTPTMAKLLKERYKNKNRVIVYPDASGGNSSTKDASVSDLSILRDAGFTIIVGNSNPAVKDRVNSMNAAFCDGAGRRRYMVNVKRCPVYTDSLEKQAYDKNGEPDKDNGFDHANDSGGYFVVNKYPINKPIAQRTRLGGT